MTGVPAPAGLLAAAPAGVVGRDAHPCIGRHAGITGAIDWRRLAPPHARSRWWRRFHHKRWHYAALVTDELFCAVAIVDLGWTNTAFAYAFDRHTRTLLADHAQDGLPGVTATLADTATGASRFRHAGSRIAFVPQKGAIALQVQCRDLTIDARIEIGDPAQWLLAVGPIAGGAVHATQKSGGLRLFGHLHAGGRQYDLQHGVASIDYSNGLLARDTRWQWASAHGDGIGFNLQAGYFGNDENALWMDGGIIPLGAACFDYDAANPLARWHVSTDDGLLDLHFAPEGARRADKNLWIAASRYVQPVGSFSGWVRPHRDAPPRRIDRLAGVTEDHFARW